MGTGHCLQKPRVTALVFSFALLIVLVSGVCSQASAKELKKVNFRLSWLLEVGDNGPYFIAKERGYYADEGIDINILAGQASPTTIKLLAGEEAGSFAFGGYGAMAQAIHQGVPVRGILGMVQEEPSSVISLADKPIKTAQDLIGKKVAVSAQSMQELLFYAALKAQNIPKDKVAVVHVPFNMANTMLLERKVDGMLQWFTTNVPILEGKGVKVHYLKYADLGVKVTGSGIMTNLKTLREQPELVKGFLRATARGIQAAQESPEEAIAALVKHNPRAAGNEKSLLENMKLIMKTYTTALTKDRPIGWIADKDWDATLDVLLNLGWIDKKLDHDNYYTNSFNPAVAWKK